MSKLTLILLLSLTLQFADKVASESGSCKYNQGFFYYLCDFTVATNVIPTDISGQHIEDNANDDVEAIINIAKNLLFIPSIICEKFENLREIDFRIGKIERIDENSLTACRELVRLELDNNNIKVLPKNVFASQSNLKSLDLEENKIRELPDGIFNPLVKLESLDLSSNGLIALNAGIFDSLTRLSFLDLANNNIETVNADLFQNLNLLRTLYLGGNYIVELPDNIFASLINLEFLRIHSNNLTTLHSSSFGANAKIKQFFLGYNQLDAIDEKIIDISTKLRTVDASDNPCVNGEVFYMDDQDARQKMRVALKKCFENYKKVQN